MKKKIGCFLIIVCWSASCFAQQAICASGGEAFGAGGAVNYTVGQVVYNNYTESTGTITQGVQQPYEIFIYTELEEAEAINLICSAYPNPATDLLLLNVENYDLKKLTYKLCDANGKTLEKKKITAKETSIKIENLISALYFLKIIDDQKEIKTFKIIKIK
jgi:hypothetical protein